MTRTEGYTLHSRTSVEIDYPIKYYKMLLSQYEHLVADENLIVFDEGIGQVTTDETSVFLDAFSDTDKSLEDIQSLLTLHLLKFVPDNNHTPVWERI